jgi:hypothetical protein
MSDLPLPVQFLAAWIGTWMARKQERLIGYLKEENRVLREKLGGKVRLTDGERRRLGRLGQLIGRKGLGEVATIATPDTILRWYRELVAKKYDDGSVWGVDAGAGEQVRWRAMPRPAGSDRLRGRRRTVHAPPSGSSARRILTSDVVKLPAARTSGLLPSVLPYRKVGRRLRGPGRFVLGRRRNCGRGVL